MESKFFSVALLATLGYTLHAAVHTVSNVPNSVANFTTVNAAITASQAGDTIYVGGSASDYGNISLNKPVVLIGSGTFTTGQSGNVSTFSNLDLSSKPINPTLK